MARIKKNEDVDMASVGMQEASVMSEGMQATEALGSEETVTEALGSEETVTEIPEMADKLLKVFDDYQELYIDTKGGVYTKDSQPNIREGAILYQNPHYKQ